ncbi:MAG: acyl-CoA dehydrogenase family protein [Polaromonas sp.]|nr:acyl-CoA dehydrogenase family protein [Polaromonas sp.]
MKPTTAHLSLPFFDDVHRELGLRLADWVGRQQIDDRQACREWVRRLGDAGWLRYCVPRGLDGVLGGALDRLDSRALVILRETLAFHSPLADFSVAMQGLGSGAITLAATPAQQVAYLPQVASGAKIAAFALSKADAGSDAGAMTTRATEMAGGWAIDGSKTWISNGGIADFYVTFVKTDPGAGRRGITAFIIDADTPGLDSSEHIAVMAPHPLAALLFTDCRLVENARLGALNGGFKLAVQTLDIFRASVAGAALGMALQLHGGLGVKVGTKVESLYRDIRSLRIYEGATEIQQLIIGKAVLQS